MKTIIIILSILSLMSCMVTKKNIKNKEYHKIIKLDSINNYYLIYTTKNDSVFKIVSEKVHLNNGQKVKIGKVYPLKVISMRENAPTIGGVKISAINYLDVNCFQFDDRTRICKEEGIYDLYFSENLKGLYYINKPDGADL